MGKKQARSILAAVTSPSVPIARHDRFVLVLFFLSGAAGLMYEISWSRQIGLLFGHTVHSSAVVLACYFAGMAIGYLIAARWVGKVVPLLGYGVAEILVAAWAPLVPWLLEGIEGSAWASWLNHPEPGLQMLIRAALAFGLLLPAAVGLGASLPFMAEHLSLDRQLAPGRVALAYALNTTGALCGVLATTAFLMIVLGVQGSGLLAAALSGFCGIAACVIAVRYRSPTPKILPEPSAVSTTIPWRSVAPWVVLAALSGFGTLGLQVLYTRMFALVFHNSTYTFGAVVAVFLAGLALGSAGVSRWHRRISVERLLGLAGGLGSALVALSVIGFVALTGLQYFTFGKTFSSYMIGVFGLVALVVLPPVTLLGALLPTIWKGAGRVGIEGGAVVGWLTAGNALAASVGALLASFIFLPGIGLWPSIALFSALFGLIPIALLIRGGQHLEAVGLALLLIGLNVYAVQVPGRIRTLPPGPRTEIIASWEGPYGLLEVVEVERGYRVLRQNLHYGLGATGVSTPRERRQGHLPLLLHPDPKEVLFLGLGTGLTAGAAIPHPEVERIDVVELIPEVVEAARYFNPENLGVVDHPKVNIRIDDARHDMLGSSRQYDVIVSDLFVPWESRTGYLYTVEHFRLARSRLQPGGLFCLWLPLYQLGADELTMIADSFATVFPETGVWWGRLSLNFGMLALVGSEEPLALDAREIDARLDEIQRSFQNETISGGLESASEFWKLYAGDWSIHRPERLNTDEFPRVEFLAPISHRGATELTGERILHAFDESLSDLPTGSVEIRPAPGDRLADRSERRVWQRGMLIRGDHQ
ncbi:hypothetical protein BH23PLA1_BH23PLA1_18200 [soil metagenome]